MQEAPPQPPPPAAPEGVRCPVCGTAAGPDQEFCVNCGNRLAPYYKRPPSWRKTAAFAGLAVLLVGGGIGAAIGLSSGGHDKNPVQTTTTTTQGAAAPAPPAATAPPAPGAITPGKPSTPATPGPGGTTPGPTPGKPSTPFPGGATWPQGKTAYTADLLETKSLNEATAKAQTAIKKGIPAGVLASDDFQTLPPGLFVVFAGEYKTSTEASAAAAGFSKKGFASAYGRLIQPKTK